MNEKPELDGQVLILTPTTITISGRPAPQPIADKITAKATVRKTLPNLPMGMTATGSVVTSAGLTIHAHGGPASTDQRQC